MRWLLLLVVLACAACGDRRSFDQRYADTGNELENRAQNIDAALESDSDSNTAASPQMLNDSNQQAL